MKIQFLPENITVVSKDPLTILKAAVLGGILIDAACQGNGTCGKCKVRILAGEVREMGEAEKRLLSPSEVKENIRLSCQAVVEGDAVIAILGTHGGTDRKKNMAKLPEGFQREPIITKHHCKVKKAKLEYPFCDVERLAKTLCAEKNEESCEKVYPFQVDSLVLNPLHDALQKKRGDMTAIFRGNQLIGAEAGDTEEESYGLAVDIGTTTVVVMLWNLCTGENIDVEAHTNPQSLFGADVISRIQYCNEGEGNRETLQKVMIDCINGMIEQLTKRSVLSGERIYDMTVVGNTTMGHLFEGVAPQSLARTPFAPVFCQSVDRRAGELGIRMNPLGNVHFLPHIAGHVGADIVGVMLATDIRNLPGTTIAIDIGTNGEVLCAKDGTVIACSTAAGPAFEGASIMCGMRAAKGAIEGMCIKDGEVILTVIGDEKPIGICGSGLVDIVAWFIRSGIVDAGGRILEEAEALEQGMPPQLARRLVKTKQGMQFVLAYQQSGESDGDILFTQQDIREVQLAKGAMYAGMKTLMKEMEITENTLDRILIAGAFGNYIKKASAVKMKLLPEIPPERIHSVGNAAGAGASMALLSAESRKNANIWAREVRHIELSANLEFQEIYMSSMGF